MKGIKRLCIDMKKKACIGIEIIGAKKARICHIAVVPQYRHNGIAWQMIKGSIKNASIDVSRGRDRR